MGKVASKSGDLVDSGKPSVRSDSPALRALPFDTADIEQHPGRVLVAESSESRLDELVGWLSTAGFDVSAEPGTRQALDRSQGESFDVLLQPTSSEFTPQDAAWLSRRAANPSIVVVDVDPTAGRTEILAVVEHACRASRLDGALTKAREDLRTVIHASSQAMALVGPSLRYLDWNSAWSVDVAGQQWHEGGSLLDHTIGGDRETVCNAAEAALTTGQSVTLSRTTRMHDGSEFPTATTLVPLGRGTADILVEVVSLAGAHGAVRLGDLIRTMPVPTMLLNRSGQCSAANDAMLHFLGSTREAVVGRLMRDMLDPDERRRWEAARGTNEPVHANLTFVRDDGTRFLGVVHASPLGGAGEESDQSLVIVTTGSRPESSSAEHIARSYAMVSVVRRLQRGDVELVLDDVLAIVASLVHATSAQLVRDGSEAGEDPPVDYDIPAQSIAKIPLPGISSPSHIVLRRPHAKPFGTAELRFLSEVADVVGKALTRERALQAQIRAATHDVLTGLPNRVFLLDAVSAELHRVATGEGTFGLIAVDLDRFHVINDGLSFDTGDELLRMVAERIARGIGEGDLLTRIGGDEFAVLVRDPLDPDDMEALAEGLSALIATPFEFHGARLRLTASMGIGFVNVALDEPEDVIKMVHLALSKAKRSGGARCVLFDGGFDSQAQSQLELVGDLRRGVESGEMEAWYQPIVDMRTGLVTGVEALCRWRHPERGLLGPADFIALAEETGTIVDLGTTILDEACRQVATWRASLLGARELALSVNVSARQIALGGLPELVVTTLVDSGLVSHALTVEITESVLLDDPAMALNAVQKLADVGVHVSIDDFGTGYSSLSYLRQFPVDEIKIDRRFVAGLGAGGAPEIAAAVIGLARSLELGLVAEGVESTDQMMALRALGAVQAQGYLWSPPMSADDFEQWWSEVAAHGLPHQPDEGPDGLPVPVPGRRAGPQVDTAVLRAVRTMLRSSTPDPAVSALEALVKELGGYAVPAHLAGDKGLPFDLSLGTSERLVPIAQPGSVSEALLMEVIPEVLEDAALALENSRLVARLTTDAALDPLTGLLNRRGIARVYRRLRNGDVIALVDLDHFKEVNDSFGHARGDEVLRAFGRLVREECRAADYVARIGGDEFVLVALQAQMDQMVHLVERMQGAWPAYRPLPVTFTAGVAIVGEDGDAEQALGRADEALYHAKKTGRAAVAVAEGSSAHPVLVPFVEQQG